MRISSRLIALGLGCMLSTTSAFADGLGDLPIKIVGGRQFHYYEIRPKDTIYSLTKRFGISTEELFETNPHTRDGLKAYDTLLFPIDDSAPSVAEKVPDNAVARHLIKKGETIIGISRKYGVTTAQLFAWNPTARDGIRAGEYIYVSDPSASSAIPAIRQPQIDVIDVKASDETQASPMPGFTEYIVKDNETFYSIANAHGLTIEQLEAANPDIAILHSGERIRIPVLNDTTLSETKITPQPVEQIVVVEPQTPARKTANIALVLPLMHRQQNQPKQAQLYTEFLKGFLIAMDSLRGGSSPVTISVFDTDGSNDTLRNIMTRPEFRSANLIVAPDNETQLALLSEYGRENNVYIFNPFVVRDETYLTNPRLMQCNIPQQQMYAKAIDGLITRYAHYTPIFVSREGVACDKASFVDDLKARFDATGIPYKELKFENRLERDNLSDLPKEKPLLFITATGRQAEVNKILPALSDYKAEGVDLMVFGYPEWTTFRGETLSNMYALNAVVYSRFFMAPEDPAAARLDGRFIYWYGKPMTNVLPRQGLLGFDSGMFLIEAMRQNDGDFSSAHLSVRVGVQNSFHFVVPEGSEGMINDALYFINYRPGEIVDGTLL